MVPRFETELVKLPLANRLVTLRSSERPLKLVNSAGLPCIASSGPSAEATVVPPNAVERALIPLPNAPPDWANAIPGITAATRTRHTAARTFLRISSSPLGEAHLREMLPLIPGLFQLRK